MSHVGRRGRPVGLLLLAGLAVGVGAAAGCRQGGQALRTRAVCMMGGFSDEMPPVCLWIDGRCEPVPRAPLADREALHARLRVVNSGPQSMTVLVTSASLTTARGEKITGAEARLDGRSVSRVTVAPGATETFDMVATVPGVSRPDAPKQLRLDLPCSYGSAHFTLAATFISPGAPLRM
jgi:hypothetical protein